MQEPAGLHLQSVLLSFFFFYWISTVQRLRRDMQQRCLPLHLSVVCMSHVIVHLGTTKRSQRGGSACSAVQKRSGPTVTEGAWHVGLFF